MDKLTMAHEYAMKCIGNPNVSVKTNNEIIAFAWKYADAMQAESDKREVSIKELMKDHVHDYIYGRVCACGAVNGAEEEWQPDWSVAPDEADAWRMYGDGKCAWLIDIGGDLKWMQSSPSFDYSDVWQDSLRTRPQ